ncbi:hypothetical protein P4S63_22305 [Pseudoalteromonas sp. B193]
MSNALKRLRDLFDDPLRACCGLYDANGKALALKPEVEALYKWPKLISSLVRQFNPQPLKLPFE